MWREAGRSRQPQTVCRRRQRPLFYPSIAKALESINADPLSLWRHASPRHRLATENLGRYELYIHSSNKWGKTYLGAAWGLSLARGRKELDGVLLPKMPTPNEGSVLSLDYEQQKASVQKTYLKLLGNWPHKAEWVGEILKSLRVRWDGCSSDDPRDWSVVRFRSQENRRAGVGARENWCHADEPPRQETWREYRKAGQPGWPYPRFITATPLSRRQWEWLREDYPKDREGVPNGRFLRIRGDLEDVRGTVLSDAEIAELIELYASDPLIEARLHGFEIDTDGLSPFRAHYDELGRWLEACTDGDWQEWKVAREVTTPQGRELVTEVVDLEVWEEYRADSVYRIVGDPSMGIDDKAHDPGEVVVWNMTTGNQCARYNGYIGEYGLGVLAAGLSKRYGNAEFDPDATGGYGSACLTGYRAAGGRALVLNTRVVPVGGIDRTDAGFTINSGTRNEFASAILEALVRSKAGHPFMKINSADTVRELMDLVFDDRMRPVTSPGRHDEGFITTGRAASLLMPGMDRKRVITPVSRETPAQAGRRKMLEEMGIVRTPQLRGGSRPRIRGLTRTH